MEDVVYYVVGFSLTIIGMLGGALYWLGGKFRQIEERFRQVDERFRQIDERFRQIDERFRQMEERFKGMEGRFGEVESGLKSYVDRSVDRVLAGFASYQEFFIEFLSAEGVIRRDRADLLKGELRRVVTLARGNPLTEEEVRRLEELIEKDELTYEEALWLREMARRLIREYGTPETWKLHVYAPIWVALARKKEGQQQES